MVLESSTVITPLYPTFSMAPAIRPPISSSLLADIVATWMILSLSFTSWLCSLMCFTTASVALSMPFLTSMGFAPAVMFLIPSVISDWASRVAVVVPSPVVSWVLDATSLTSLAPMFSNLSFSSISFAMVTPSFVTTGLEGLSSTTLRPFGPNVIFTVLATLSTPFNNDLRAFSWNVICLEVISTPHFPFMIFLIL